MKTFVIDTNVLLRFPDVLFAFEDNKVVLTDTVIEELDNHKSDNNDTGLNARIVARALKELRKRGKLSDGVKLDNGGMLITVKNKNTAEIPEGFDKNKHDNIILQTCKELQDTDEHVIFVSNDILASIKAEEFNVETQEFQTGRAPSIDKQYTGRLKAYIDDEQFTKFYNSGMLKISETELFQYDDNGTKYTIEEDIFPHEFLILFNSSSQSAIAKIDYTGTYIEKLQFDDMQPYGLIPRNTAQKFMIEALMSDVNNIPLVIIKGVAGTAKTLCSLAAGLETVVEHNAYRRILLCRPAISMDEDLGYLPGTEEEKIAPYMRSAMDNLEILVDSSAEERYKNEDELQGKVQEIFQHGWIEMQAVGFLRGRSITQQFVIIDEAQQLTPNQVKCIVTRVGEGTKLILCGDPDQVDTPFLDGTNNGLSWISEKMKGSPLCAQITASASECVRSKLAEDAINRLK